MPGLLPEGENGRAELVTDNREHVARASSPGTLDGAPSGPAAAAASGTLAAALAMIDRLPLTDGEKAEAVRRLLNADSRA